MAIYLVITEGKLDSVWNKEQHLDGTAVYD